MTSWDEVCFWSVTLASLGFFLARIFWIRYRTGWWPWEDL